MADMRHCARDQRCVLGDYLRTLGAGVTRERADFDHAVFFGDAVEPADAIDVDQQARRRQPHVERGDKALPAGEQSRVWMLAEQRNRLVESRAFL